MDTRHHCRRPGAAAALAATVLGVVFGMTGCTSGTGGGEPRASQVATDREPKATRSASAQPTRSRETDSATTRPPTSAATRTVPARTAATAGTTTRPPTSAAAAPPPAKTARTSTAATPTTPAAKTTAAATTKPPAAAAAATTPSAVPASATTSGIGPFGWLTLFVLSAALIVGGLLLYRSQRKSAWDSEARASESETRALTGPPLSSLLIVGKAGQRSVSWPPLRASLTDLVSRWNALVEQAPGDERRNWAGQVSALLQNLIAAVDAENESMALGDDWTILRPRVRQAQQSLAAVLAGQSPLVPPPAGEPGPPAYQS